jgi:hypothetical protein
MEDSRFERAAKSALRYSPSERGKANYPSTVFAGRFTELRAALVTFATPDQLAFQ